MEQYYLDQDIKVFYITAASFPDGIMDAYGLLHTLLPSTRDRRFYGISRPEKGYIVYKAAVEELFEGESEKYNCETMLIRKGSYVSILVKDFKTAQQQIGQAFMELLATKGLDPKGYCIEMYLGPHDVRCMIRIDAE